MIDDARAYAALMAVLRERMPDLHEQLADEVARGKEVRGKDIKAVDRKIRDRQLDDEKLGRIGESDVSVLPYSDEERLDLLINALRTSVETRSRSLQTLGNLLERQSVANRRVNFRRPESGESEGVDVPSVFDDVVPEAGIAQQLESLYREVKADRSERGNR